MSSHTIRTASPLTARWHALLPVTWMAAACAAPTMAVDAPANATTAVESAAPAAIKAAPPAASVAALHIAHSALLSVDAIPTANALLLQIRRAKDNTALTSAEVADVAVAIDGKSETATRAGDRFQLGLDDLRGATHEIDITVGHDGIREILSGQIRLPDSSVAGSLWRDHKQVAWWVLNIVIVLIAAIAISRRRS